MNTVPTPSRPDAEAMGRYIYEQLDQFMKNMERSQFLVDLYNTVAKDFPDSKGIHATDILRASVVFMHAALEDFIRSLMITTFPFADREHLDQIPLSGLSRTGRAEKFFLGELVRFKGVSVADVIQQSVREHVARRTFNNRGDILLVVNALGLREQDVAKVLPKIEAMLYRRHQIVHHADKPVPEDQQWIRATSLSPRHVSSWIAATRELVSILLTGAIVTKFFKPLNKSPRKRRT
jgi:hypothetical protein